VAWRIVVCDRHRRLSDWSVPGNLRRLDTEESGSSCGTVWDYRPHAEVIVSHLRGWMGANGVPEGSPLLAEDDWLGYLRRAHEWFAFIRDAELAAVVERALLLAGSSDMPGIVALLAQAETSAAVERARAERRMALPGHGAAG
jgi:hypothetical protein